MRSRSGFALIEVLVTAVLSSLVLSAAAMLLHGQSRLARNISERSERNDAMRSALATVQLEVRNLDPATDLRAVARDSIAARIFRGVAVVCGFRTGTIYVRYRGLRLPDPAKDSLLQVGVENTESLDFIAASDDACPHARDEQVLAARWNAPAIPGSVWLVFESGSYHFSTNALRYRRGPESRQPITNEVLNDRTSSFALIGDSSAYAIRAHVRQRGGAATMIANLPMLNHP